MVVVSGELGRPRRNFKDPGQLKMVVVSGELGRPRRNFKDPGQLKMVVTIMQGEGAEFEHAVLNFTIRVQGKLS